MVYMGLAIVQYTGVYDTYVVVEFFFFFSFIHTRIRLIRGHGGGL